MSTDSTLPVNAEELSRAIKRHYGFTCQCEPLEGEGYRVWRVKTDQGIYCAKLIPKTLSSDRLNSVLAFIKHLNMNGIMTIRPRPTLSGSHWVNETNQSSLDARRLILYHWIHGKPPESDPASLKSRGQLLARFHQVSSTFQASSQFQIKDWSSVYVPDPQDEWVCAIRNQNSLGKNTQALDEAIKVMHHFFDADNPYLANKVVLHADFHEDNLIETEHGLCILDFDEIGWGHLPFDVVWPAALIAGHQESTSDFLNPFIEGYCQIGGFDHKHLREWKLATALSLVEMLVSEGFSPDDQANGTKWYLAAGDWLAENL